MFVFHGWMDSSASFQFMVDAFAREWHVLAADWRGYGLTGRPQADCYWFPDYVADLDRILAHYSLDTSVNLVGHSMGGNIACLYGGIRPQRVAKIVNLEGFGMPATRPEDAPRRYARWLDELADQPTLRDYESVDAFAERLMRGNSRLTAERARFVAENWSEPLPNGHVRILGDPAHKIVNPTLYRLEESMACWRAVTGAGALGGRRAHRNAQADAPHRGRSRGAQAVLRAARGAHHSRGGHMLHHDQPEALARLVETFLAD